MIKKYYFWNNFSRYLTIGLSALILLVASQQMVLGDVFQRGPNQVLAEEDNCLNSIEDGCPEPGGGGQLPPEAPPTPEVPAPPAPAPEAPAPAAACPFEFKYNECIACNTSQPVEQDCNGTFRVGPAQADSACANFACEAAAPPPPPAPAPPPAPRPAPPPPAQVVASPITNINQNQNSNTTNVTTNVSNNTSVSNSSSSFASVSVPSGGQQIVREVIREVPVVREAVVSGNVGVGSSAGQVLAVKELPKTGLPALAWAALAFIPAGVKIKRFSKVKQELIDNPSYIWESRQFKVGS